MKKLQILLVLPFIFMACLETNEMEPSSNSNFKKKSPFDFDPPQSYCSGISGSAAITNYLENETETYSYFVSELPNGGEGCDLYFTGSVQYSKDINPGNYLGGTCCQSATSLDQIVSDMVSLIDEPYGCEGIQNYKTILVEWDVKDHIPGGGECEIDYIVHYYCCVAEEDPGNSQS